MAARRRRALPTIDPQSVADTDVQRKLHACLTCKLIKSQNQFHRNFCENCPGNTPEQGDDANDGVRRDWVDTRTTKNFEGMIALMAGRGSWVARRQELFRPDLDMQGRQRADKFEVDGLSRDYFVPGMYALRLRGQEDEEAGADGDLDAGQDVGQHGYDHDDGFVVGDEDEVEAEGRTAWQPGRGDDEDEEDDGDYDPTAAPAPGDDDDDDDDDDDEGDIDQQAAAAVAGAQKQVSGLFEDEDEDDDDA